MTHEEAIEQLKSIWFESLISGNKERIKATKIAISALEREIKALEFGKILKTSKNANLHEELMKLVSAYDGEEND